MNDALENNPVRSASRRRTHDSIAANRNVVGMLASLFFTTSGSRVFDYPYKRLPRTPNEASRSETSTRPKWIKYSHVSTKSARYDSTWTVCHGSLLHSVSIHVSSSMFVRVSWKLHRLLPLWWSFWGDLWS